MKYFNKSGSYTNPKAYDRRISSKMLKYMWSLWNPMLISFIGKYINDKKELVVCDLGCGTLEFSKYMTGPRLIYAVDINKGMMKEGLNKITNKKKIVLMQEDSMHTSLSNSSCDVVWCIGLVEFVDVNNLFKEISRILKPGGFVILSYLNRNSFLMLEEHFYQRFIRKGFVKKNYSDKKIFGALVDSGLKLIKRINIGCAFWVPVVLEKYFVWMWRLLEKMNIRNPNFWKLGFYNCLILEKV